eukprot:5025205-Pyramimonas_sp.AAC.1
MEVHLPCGYQESGMRLWDGAQRSQVQGLRGVSLSKDQGPSIQVSQPPQLFPGAHGGQQRSGAPAGHVRGHGQRSRRQARPLFEVLPGLGYVRSCSRSKPCSG